MVDGGKRTAGYCGLRAFSSIVREDVDVAFEPVRIVPSSFMSHSDSHASSLASILHCFYLLSFSYIRCCSSKEDRRRVDT